MAETMTTQERPLEENWVPTDTWGARLAIVRQKMGWNYTEAGKECGINATSWHNWEDGGGCRQMHRIAHKIARRTGVSFTWLVAGGPMPQPDPDDVKSRCDSVIDLRVIPGGGKSHQLPGQAPLPFLSLLGR